MKLGFDPFDTSLEGQTESLKRAGFVYGEANNMSSNAHASKGGIFDWLLGLVIAGILKLLVVLVLELPIYALKKLFGKK